MRDLELGDLLFAGISGGVWCDMRGSTLGVNMPLACILHMHIMDTVDDLIGVDLEASSVLLDLKVLDIFCEYLHGVREPWLN